MDELAPGTPRPDPAPPPRHKTTALPLALACAALVAYASLYPFAGWRDQGIAPWAYLWAPWPKYWTGFDLAVNVAGYVPLGFLVALAALRTSPGGRALQAAAWGAATGVLMSLLMEGLQSYLPERIPSNLDFGLNSGGALIGAVLAAALERTGVVARWGRARAQWFVDEARGALGLLALWPVALLFPAAVPFGLGQVFERLETGIAESLQDTPLLDWMPVREFELQPLVPAVELLCVALGLLAPCLLAYTVARSLRHRLLLLLGLLGLGVTVSALSAAMSYGPEHAWAWLNVPVQVGLAVALGGALMLLPLRRRPCLALLLVAVGVQLALLNQAPESAYFAQTLATWEQGRFIRFHGLVQWLGWVWPFGVLGYALVMLVRRPPGRAAALP